MVTRSPRAGSTAHSRRPSKDLGTTLGPVVSDIVERSRANAGIDRDTWLDPRAGMLDRSIIGREFPTLTVTVANSM